MIGAVAAGLVLAFACIFGVEMVGHQLFPLPSGIDVSTAEGQAAMMAAIPFEAKAVVIVGWFVGALAGGWLADRIAGQGLAGWVVAGLVMAASVATMMMIPHPAWMWAAGILLPPVAAWLAQRLARVPFRTRSGKARVSA